jgi:nitrate/nitrite transporter NarK
MLTAYGASDYYRSDGPGYAFMNSFLKGYSPELKMMLLGRFFYGLGAETSIVVVSKILVKWFKGRDLALAFGLKVGFGRLGTAAALIISPELANGGATLTVAIWFAAVLVLAGLLAFIVYMWFDARLDKQLAQDTEKSAPEAFRFSDITKLLTNPAYVLIALLCVTFYSAVFPFNAFAPDLLFHKFGMSFEQSGLFTSLMPIATMVFTPLFGMFIDRKGKAATLMIFGSLTLLFVHLSFAYTYIPPFIPMILMGIAFSLIPATMWPSMVKLVDDKVIGTAYGLMYSIQNLGLFTFPILAGYILDRSNPGNPETLDYTSTMTMFVFLSLMGFIFALLLKQQDSRKGFGIELPLNKK